MQQNTSTPICGVRCLAAPDGYWVPGKVHRVNEDHTYTVELDEKPLILMPHWIGVTHDQISVDDETLWPEVFPRLTCGSLTMDRPTFATALKNVGFCIDDDQFGAFWDKQCEELFGLKTDATAAALTRGQAYQMLIRGECCAKRFIHRDHKEQDYYKLYWNQVRMAGRQPSDITRTVVLDDAFDALGIRQPTFDPASRARVEKFQTENDVKLPPNLHRFLCCSGISKAVVESHPNSPELVLPGDEYYNAVLWRDPPLDKTAADYAMAIMIPHAGAHVWAAAFSRDDADARVYVKLDEDNWILTAPTIGFFFWDLAQTGLIWYQNTGYEGGKAITKTDIGVAPKIAG